ncbi:MAG: presqualene diphosphate synthase HpnD [Ignavibacteriae bacterium]|nr:presqualene diphosphate synthase HpnD [Ignavibacteriota bacterium]MCB9211309.1 presqualene diphosphate synthase HpnD [Ignavibacteriales bacterium]MCB9218701.1 presqualene diphosphate synthase HpnD [Ignavibacteriales bacterium]MCB9259293.1 presqualene diphosphate synthase HpnD [Ignavibacteriales bacterium]
MIQTSKEISKESKSSFYYTFSLLPSNKRDAMNTVYAFCRKTDDIVDNEEQDIHTKQNNLEEWKLKLTNALNGKTDNKLFSELYYFVNEFNIPHQPFYDLIAGMEMDLTKIRYQNFDELKEYCYNVASTVGLMTIPIIGYKNDSAKDYAINLGIALQLTNILRDIKTDSKRGRIYLPLDELAQFNYSEDDLFKRSYNENFINLMKFQSERAREFYKAADRKLSIEDKASMFTPRSMEYIYYRLLDKIEQENFNIFSKKIRVSNFNKLFITFFVWLKYKLLS